MKQGSAQANTLGTIAVMYSAFGVILTWLRGTDDDVNTLASATATGMLYKSTGTFLSLDIFLPLKNTLYILLASMQIFVALFHFFISVYNIQAVIRQLMHIKPKYPFVRQSCSIYSCMMK